jgi:hypothetical protein
MFAIPSALASLLLLNLEDLFSVDCMAEKAVDLSRILRMYLLLEYINILCSTDMRNENKKDKIQTYL